MADNQQEPKVDDGLANLPENERKETEEIIEEARAVDAKKEPPKEQKPEPPKQEPPKKEEPPKTEGEEPPKPPKKEPEPRREPKLMPAWQHEVAAKNWDKERKDLTAKIEELSKGKPPADPSKPESSALDAQITELSKTHNIAPELLKSLVDLASKAGGKLPDDFQERMAEIDKVKSEREIEVEEARFSNDFEKIVVPLVKAEYGENVPPDVVSAIKDKLKETAYQPEYAKIPYEVIYKGVAAFRELVPPEKRSAEPGRGGGKQIEGVGKSLEEITEEDIKGMTNEQFDEYTKQMEAKERQGH